MMKYLSVLIFMICVSLGLVAQKEKTTTTAQDEIKNFKNGAAVVRLYMNKPKVDLLKKSIEGATDPQEKKDLEKMLDIHINERKAYKEKLIEAFTKNFDFAKLYFINDYDILRLKNGERKGIFLNKLGELDQSITMDEVDYLIFARGQNDSHVELIRPDNQALPEGFPTKYNRNIGRLFTMLFQPRDKLSESIFKLNHALHKYHSRMNE